MSTNSSARGPVIGERSAEGSLLAVEARLPVKVRRALKRAFDVGAGTALLVALGLLFVVVAAAILALEGRPVLYRHRRVGKGGAPFACLKFRTMARDADAALVRHLAENPAAMVEWQATRKLKDDPRITPLGRLLRESSLDELPQLVNVIRGDMSLVGPRPIVADERRYYGAAIAEYETVRPGLTGPWQCSGRSDVGYEHRVMLDRQYVRAWTFTQDIVILFRTIPAVLKSRGVY